MTIGLPPEYQPYGDVATDIAERAVPPVQVTDASKAKVGGILAAVQGALAGGITSFSLAVQDNVISGGEWVGITAAVIVGSGLFGGAVAGTVYATTNKPVS